MSWNLQIPALPFAEVLEAIETEAKAAEGQLKAALDVAKQLVTSGHVGDKHVGVLVYGQEGAEGSQGGDSHIHVTVTSHPDPAANLPVEVSGPIMAEGSEPPPDSPPAGAQDPSIGDPPAVDDGAGQSAAPDEGPSAAADPDDDPEAPAQ